MNTQFYWGIIAGGLIALVAILIPAILQIKRTAKAAEDFLHTTQESLNPLLRRLQETVETTNQVAEKLDESMNNVRHLTKSVGQTAVIVDDINKVIRHIDTFTSVRISSIGVGIKTALSVLTQGFIKKEVGK